MKNLVLRPSYFGGVDKAIKREAVESGPVTSAIVGAKGAPPVVLFAW